MPGSRTPWRYDVAAEQAPPPDKPVMACDLALRGWSINSLDPT
jgi:hypothetical protein